MHEREFLDKLEHALKALPAAQRSDILTEYRSHFFEARERGKQDTEIAAALGDPRTLGQTYMADYHFLQWQQPGGSVGQNLSHLLRGGLVLISLLFFNFFFMLWPFLLVVSLLAAGWIVVLSVMAASLAFGVGGLVGGVSNFVLTTLSAKFALFFYMLAALFLGLILLRALLALSRCLLVAALKYIKLNLKLMTS